MDGEGVNWMDGGEVGRHTERGETVLRIQLSQPGAMNEEEKQWKRDVLTLQLLSYLRSSLLLRFHMTSRKLWQPSFYR